eukprot:scaffold1779_cov373-Prasinococcus_capsulatus_cf.AAC.5
MEHPTTPLDARGPLDLSSGSPPRGPTRSCRAVGGAGRPLWAHPPAEGPSARRGGRSTRDRRRLALNGEDRHLRLRGRAAEQPRTARRPACSALARPPNGRASRRGGCAWALHAAAAGVARTARASGACGTITRRMPAPWAAPDQTSQPGGETKNGGARLYITPCLPGVAGQRNRWRAPGAAASSSRSGGLRGFARGDRCCCGCVAEGQQQPLRRTAMVSQTVSSFTSVTEISGPGNAYLVTWTYNTNTEITGALPHERGPRFAPLLARCKRCAAIVDDVRALLAATPTVSARLAGWQASTSTSATRATSR